MSLTQVDQGLLGQYAQYTGFKNRIINGAMQIDQRNAGASVTLPSAANTYTLDRWTFQASQASKISSQQNAGSVTPPVGFTNYLGVTSLSAYSIGSTDYFTLGTKIEGLNVADLAWGTASAATVTLSFKVYSSLTGTFGGALLNSAGIRSYPFTYTISSANTWTTISITIPGDQSGTWLTTNGVGILVYFGLGVGSTYSGAAGSWSGGGYNSATGATSVVGTNGATFYITGVQFEKGSTATSFDYRPYGTELALCQRYYQVAGLDNCAFAGRSASTTVVYFSVPLSVALRASPTVSDIGATYLYSNFARTNSSGGSTAVTAFNANSTIIGISKSGFTGLTNDNIYNVGSIASSLTLSAEL